ncbi:hypothetical protein C1646_711626 [Rhizophagus diaphanus]|nr:hypothetical protein C1646_711626 [Rhizophagus diaphanus] [Rhizophagus sp. MUCL 43196]
MTSRHFVVIWHLWVPFQVDLSIVSIPSYSCLLISFWQQTTNIFSRIRDYYSRIRYSTKLYTTYILIVKQNGLY